MSLDHSTVTTRWRSDPLAFKAPAAKPTAPKPAKHGIAQPLTKAERTHRDLAYQKSRLPFTHPAPNS